MENSEIYLDKEFEGTRLENNGESVTHRINEMTSLFSLATHFTFLMVMM